MSDITVDQWTAELDKFVAASSISPVVQDRGFTIYDLMERCSVSRYKAREMIMAAMKAGTLRIVGCRPGQGAAKVYETIKGAK